MQVSINSRNPLRIWFSRFPKPMSQKDFAIICGISSSYLVALLREDNPPWPNKELLLKIAEVTKGEVSPNDMAGWDGARRKRVPEPEPDEDAVATSQAIETLAESASL